VSLDPLRVQAVDSARLWDGLDAVMSDAEAFHILRDHCPGLVSSYVVDMASATADSIASVAASLARILALPDIRASALRLGRGQSLPDHPPAPGLLAVDFHLTPQGPRLIEINTNPGGLLIADALARAVLDTPALDGAILSAFREDWRSPAAPPEGIAIVDDGPARQFLFPEFLLYRNLFTRAGIAAEIADPTHLAFDGRVLSLHGKPAGLIYNRLTDFFLDSPRHAVLDQAWRNGAARLVPDPLSHALFSDKRLLSLLCDRQALLDHGADQSDASGVSAAVPATEVANDSNWDGLWQRRKSLFFKPAKGHAGKAAYRGDKLSRSTWNSLYADDYVAQDLTPAPRVSLPGGGTLKADIRAFLRGGTVLLLAARLYDGQTTNFRTPGGGFAPVRVRQA
jgi:hypothetical protein